MVERVAVGLDPGRRCTRRTPWSPPSTGGVVGFARHRLCAQAVGGREKGLFLDDLFTLPDLRAPGRSAAP